MTDYKLMPVEPSADMLGNAMSVCTGFSGDYGTYNCYLSEDAAREVYQAFRAVAPAVQGEPVAWMHDSPGRMDVIHAAVKKLLADSHDAAGHLHRPLDKSQHYTIPLYAAPQPAEQQPTLDVAARRQSPPDDPLGGLTYQPDGDANFYTLSRPEGRWVARIQFNGELYGPEQERILESMLGDRNVRYGDGYHDGLADAWRDQPDVAGLVTLLEHARCNTCDGSGGLYDNHRQPHQCQWCHDRSKALAAYRKGGEA